MMIVNKRRRRERRRERERKRRLRRRKSGVREGKKEGEREERSLEREKKMKGKRWSERRVMGWQKAEEGMWVPMISSLAFGLVLVMSLMRIPFVMAEDNLQGVSVSGTAGHALLFSNNYGAVYNFENFPTTELTFEGKSSAQ